MDDDTNEMYRRLMGSVAADAASDFSSGIPTTVPFEDRDRMMYPAATGVPLAVYAVFSVYVGGLGGRARDSKTGKRSSKANKQQVKNFGTDLVKTRNSSPLRSTSAGRDHNLISTRIDV